MKKLTAGLLIFAAVMTVGWLVLSNMYTHEVSEELTLLRRESRSDLVYLRNRVRELESELYRRGESSPAPAETAADTEADGGITEPATEGDLTEAVTVPTHNAPETQPVSEESDTEIPAALYLVAEYNGVIGVFDAAGELLHTVNVFIMTLPEADREALAVGIPAYSLEEALELTERYE